MQILQSEDRMDARVDAMMDAKMEQLEKTILTAMGKNNSPDPMEKDKQSSGPEDGNNCYGSQ